MNCCKVCKSEIDEDETCEYIFLDYHLCYDCYIYQMYCEEFGHISKKLFWSDEKYEEKINEYLMDH